MARKVFLSFLGTSIYTPTFYKASNQNENEVYSTRFIQEALIDYFCKDFTENDKIFILTTNEALHNWDGEIHFNNSTKENVIYESLKTRIEKLHLNPELKNILIPNGKSTDEIWEIFQKTFDEINDKDELIFDITHGFRSLPMLNMVLINYAKLLKNISVSGIYYGNWEARYPKGDKSFSPIWDLKDFERLQEWTNAAQLFLKAGYADKLSEMMIRSGMKGAHEIKSFCQEILTNRGISLTQGDSAIHIRNLLSEKKNVTIHPVVKPIFKKVENEFIKYEKNNVLNGLLAIKWCIDHNLIQQGYTLMSEFLPSYILHFINERYDDKDARNTINGFLGINGNIEKFKFKDSIKKRQTELLNKTLKIPLFKRLCERNRSINPQNRDDINHAGFRKNPKEYEIFKSELVDKYEKLKEVIFKIESQK